MARAERRERGGTKRLRTAEKTLTNRCRYLGDRKPCITRSRRRNGRCEFSARLLSPLCERCSTVWHDLAPGGSVGAELVGDHPSWWAALLLQKASQQALGCLGVASALDNLIEHIAVLIHGPPEPVFLARDGDHDLIQVPDVATAWRLAPEAASVRRPELQRPATDGLIRDDDAALEQHLLDQSQAQRKPEIQPHRMGDDLRRKAVTFVADRLSHAGPSTRSRSNPS